MHEITGSNSNITIESSEEEVIISISGDIDETFTHSEIPRTRAERIILELSQIRHYNSRGIREWIFFIRDLSAYGNVFLRRCSIAVIDQINLTPDSLGKCRVESFYAPYFCECQGELIKLIDYENHMTQIRNGFAPEFKCDQCQKPLEFDALVESYFLFARDDLATAG